MSKASSNGVSSEREETENVSIQYVLQASIQIWNEACINEAIIYWYWRENDYFNEKAINVYK